MVAWHMYIVDVANSYERFTDSVFQMLDSKGLGLNAQLCEILGKPELRLN